LQQARGLNYVFIRHDLSVIRAIADEIAVMKAAMGPRNRLPGARAGLYKGAY